ncbi:amidohydrolase family protein [Kaustia mangrovi]|uniref:Amidohydrolase family protein n=1 Tax=Kaustia mangrovi TaxID=2593653 RepID=A0A7S8C6R7_9HYPH|nr:D-aminoacylase [Kaustia mangrovi]QPC44361.1 amidohydrolase family protein [Kaustia mangrovi]
MKRRADIVIRDAMLIDGTGSDATRGDLAVVGDRIVAMGELKDWAGAREIDAEGLAVAPGFVDVHTHDDRAVLATDMTAKLSQGVTTVVSGNCGISLGPVPGLRDVVPPLDLIAEGRGDLFATFADYLAALDARVPPVNVAALTGHTTLRLATMDRLDRAATAAECGEMRRLLAEALEAGSIGLSTGLYYQPANAASTAEVIAVAEPLARYNGIYATHMRDEADLIRDAMEEAFEIGRASDSPVVISHHKVTDPKNYGRTRETLPVIAERAREQPVTLDVYPYAASSTVLEARRAASVDRIMITWSKARPDLAGRMLADIADEMGVSREDAVARLQPAGAVYFTMDEDDVQRVLKFPLSMIGSDGLPHDIRPHPRLWGTFPRVLGHYARDVGLFGLEEAVRRMTALPAARFGLKGRGRLAEGAFADLVVFDPATVLDRADYADPVQLSAGIKEVFVNGRTAWTGAAPGEERAGRVLRNHDLAPKDFESFAA